MEKNEIKMKRSEWMDLLASLENSIAVTDEEKLGFTEEDCVEEVIICAK